MTLAQRVDKVDLRWWFLLIGAVVGAFQILAIPPGLGIDESSHFRRVWAISQGEVIAHRRGPDTGVEMPGCLASYVQYGVRHGGFPIGMVLSHNFSAPSNCDDTPRWVSYITTAPYSPVAYLPQIVGVTVGRAAHLPPAVLFLTGRLFGLAAYLALGLAALRIAPRGRLLLFVVGLLPMALLSAATYNGDSFLVGLVLLASAALLRAREDRADVSPHDGAATDHPPTSARWFVLAAVCFALITLCKPPYLLFAPLLVLIPQGSFRTRSQAVAAKAVAIGTIVVCAGAWAYATRSFKPIDPRLARVVGVDAAQQLKWSLHHPLNAALAGVRALGFAKPAEMLVTTSISNWWKIRAVQAGSPTLPIWATLLGLGLIVGGHAAEWGPARAATRADRLRALFPTLVQVLTLAGVTGTLWLMYTPMGAPQVYGLQGRYFVPLFAVGVLTVCGLRLPRPTRWPQLPFVAGAALLGAAAMLKTGLYYYGTVPY